MEMLGGPVLHVLVLLSFLPYASGGSFECHPCLYPDCYFANSNSVLNIPGPVGETTCGAIRQNIDQYNPEQCGNIQSQTLAASDPCGCRHPDGSDCSLSSVATYDGCDLCGESKVIGDPNRIIKAEGPLKNFPCITAYDANSGGVFNGMCPEIRNAIVEYCSCVDVGVYAKQCIPMEKHEAPCDPQDNTDVCCDGFCRYRDHFGQHVCTSKDAEPIPGSTPSPPAPSPTPAPPTPLPTSPPTHSPTDAPTLAPTTPKPVDAPNPTTPNPTPLNWDFQFLDELSAAPSKAPPNCFAAGSNCVTDYDCCGSLVCTDGATGSTCGAHPAGVRRQRRLGSPTPQRANSSQ